MTASFCMDQVKGFLSDDEGLMLARYVVKGLDVGEALEIGSWCGKSAIYMARAAAGQGRMLFCLDHHRGSEENQPDWQWFDAEVWDDQAEAIDTLPHFRRNIRMAGLEESVVAIIGRSEKIGLLWNTALGFLFLDGGHTMKAALADYRAWAGHIAKGGFLAIHDVFPDPKDGGRPPFEVCQLALNSGLFAQIDQVDSLVILQKL